MPFWGGVFLSLKSRQTLCPQKLNPGFCPFSSELEPRTFLPGESPGGRKLGGGEVQAPSQARHSGPQDTGAQDMAALCSHCPSPHSGLVSISGICALCSPFLFPLKGPQKLQMLTVTKPKSAMIPPARLFPGPRCPIQQRDTAPALCWPISGPPYKPPDFWGFLGLPRGLGPLARPGLELRNMASSGTKGVRKKKDEDREWFSQGAPFLPREQVLEPQP